LFDSGTVRNYLESIKRKISRQKVPGGRDTLPKRDRGGVGGVHQDGKGVPSTMKTLRKHSDSRPAVRPPTGGGTLKSSIKGGVDTIWVRLASS